MLEGYKWKAPNQNQKLEVPLVVSKYTNMISSDKAEQDKAIKDLTLVAFYFLLWVGKYIYYKASDKQCTKQFWLKHITLWHQNTRLDPSLPKDFLLEHYTTAKMSISNLKNGKQVHIIYQ